MTRRHTRNLAADVAAGIATFWNDYQDQIAAFVVSSTVAVVAVFRACGSVRDRG